MMVTGMLNMKAITTSIEYGKTHSLDSKGPAAVTAAGPLLWVFIFARSHHTQLDTGWRADYPQNLSRESAGVR